MIIWQCTRCGRTLDDNPLFCPHCGYTVYRPVGRKQ
jgi:rubrerythrin